VQFGISIAVQSGEKGWWVDEGIQDNLFEDLAADLWGKEFHQGKLGWSLSWNPKGRALRWCESVHRLNKYKVAFICVAVEFVKILDF
jgi:hypothetical protein